jgi:hypothetical protein
MNISRLFVICILTSAAHLTVIKKIGDNSSTNENLITEQFGGYIEVY